MNMANDERGSKISTTIVEHHHDENGYIYHHVGEEFALQIYLENGCYLRGLGKCINFQLRIVCLEFMDKEYLKFYPHSSIIK